MPLSYIRCPELNFLFFATFSLDAMRPFSFPRGRFCDVTQCKSILKREQGGSQWGLNVSLKRAKTDYGKPLGEKKLKI